MSGQDRTDQRACEEMAQISGAETGRPRVRQGLGQGAWPGRSAGAAPRAHLPDVVLVFGKVGEMREIAEGAHDAHGLADRHAVEDELELAPRRPVVVPVEPDRGLPDALDQIEYVGAFLIAYGISEDASEQADIGPQPGILFRRRGLIGAIGPQIGVRRHDLGGHGWWLQKTARHPPVAIFQARRKTKKRAMQSRMTSLILRSGRLAASRRMEARSNHGSRRAKTRSSPP